MNTRDLLPIQRLEHLSLEDEVAGTLRRLIVTGKLPEGTQLRQRDLAERLGVSPTPVRVVLGRLERDGLVAIGTTGRAEVSRLTREDFEEIYAARLGLEGLAARHGAKAVRSREVGRMRKLFRQLEELAKQRDIDEYLMTRWQFHGICYRASGRSRLLAEVERLFWRSNRYNRLVLSAPERFPASLRNYGAFLAACGAQDGDEAERVIHIGLSWAVELLWETLPSERDFESDRR